MTISQLNSIIGPKFEFFKHLYLSSFPPEERRPMAKLEEYILTKQHFTIYIFEENNELVGFFSVWDLGDFTYGEHFAIDEHKRSGGIGSRVVRELLSICKLPLILEVEHPIEEMAVRRIGFYQRLGFTLSDYEYIQPPYSPSLSAVSLKLMEYGGELVDTNPQMVEKVIHSVVYGIVKQ